MVYKFPDSARFGKVVPKTRICEKAKSPTKLKRLFAEQIDKIIWSYKLSPETINIPASDSVKEIQVFTIELKTENPDNALLAAIDRAVPSPIIFILGYGGKIRYAAAYKRPSLADANKWVVSDYCETEWIDMANSRQVELPIALNMGALYEALLRNFIQLPGNPEEGVEELIARVERLNALRREVAKLKNKRDKTRQFNRKVEINAQIKRLEGEVAILAGSQ